MMKKWIKEFGNFKNIVINKKGYISDWIYKAKIVIHAGCTGGLEASLRNKFTISYYPLDVKHGHPFADKFSKKIKSEAKLIELVCKIYNKKTKLFQKKSDIIISSRAANLSKLPAYKKISNVWKELLKKKNYKHNNIILLRFKFFIRDLRSYFLKKKIW